MDIPTLADPVVRDLLQESDLFARSFHGGGFGLLSPLDFVHIISLMTEIASHLLLILSLTGGPTHICVLLLSLASATLPLLVSWCGFPQRNTESPYNAREARAADRQERMRNLAYSDAHRPEIALFGLGPWILESWAKARKIVMASEQPSYLRDSLLLSKMNFSDFVFALQNVRSRTPLFLSVSDSFDQVPLVLLLQTPSLSLGSLAMYRSSIQSVIFASGNLVTTTKMAFQGIFLMSAYCASIKLKPRLQPREEEKAEYEPLHGGMGINVRYGSPLISYAGAR